MIKLSNLKLNEKALIKSIKINDPLKRRLFELGMMEGEEITCKCINPFGSLKAYLIKQSLFAIRKEDADKVLVHKI
jgi:Fe2+ transport system protein FeoA